MECEGECATRCLCGLEGAIDTLSKKWTLLIINTLGNHQKLRYKEIMGELETISPKALSDSLKKLERENLIQRRAYNEIPPKVEYSLTEDGKELKKAIFPLLDWVSKRYLNQEKCVSY
ncbi:MAG: helix-turn-helix domain-containing protein, partial [Candidatus Bathyarchaeia archaeon]